MARNPRSEHNFIYPKFSGFPLENRQIIGERNTLSSLRDITKMCQHSCAFFTGSWKGRRTSCTPVPSLRAGGRGDGTSSLKGQCHEKLYLFFRSNNLNQCFLNVRRVFLIFFLYCCVAARIQNIFLLVTTVKTLD